MSLVYCFEAKIVSFGKGRHIIYPPREYQEKLKQFHGRKVKVVVIIEPE
jgi:hypothetical protein